MEGGQDVKLRDEGQGGGGQGEKRSVGVESLTSVAPLASAVLMPRALHTEQVRSLPRFLCAQDTTM